MSETSLRVAFPYVRLSESYDPARIELAPEYIFLENIFSPLVEMSPTGSISPGVATSFDWVGNEAHFQIRKDLKTADGHPITANDAAASLKRLIALTGNTHGDLKSMLCPHQSLARHTDPCPGIEVRDGVLILKPPGDKKQFLVPMLTTIDFAVIPAASIDPITMKIRDYRNTSGPYYVGQDAGNGHIILKANPSHFHYSAAMPQVVELVPVSTNDPDSSLTAFASGQVDHITTVDHVAAERLIDFSRTSADATLHQTQNIRVLTAFFTQRGLRELSAQNRTYMALALKREFRKYFSGRPGFEVTDQYFPVFGEGGLDQLLKNFLTSKVAISANEQSRTIYIELMRVSNPQKMKELIRTALMPNQAVQFIDRDLTDSSKSSEQEPHICLSGPDTGFNEDISLLSYSMSMDDFGLGKEGGQKWIAAYMQIPYKAQRLEKLRGLHLQALVQPVIVPLVSSPYVALIRSPWKMELSQIYANNPFWMIRHGQ